MLESGHNPFTQILGLEIEIVSAGKIVPRAHGIHFSSCYIEGIDSLIVHKLVGWRVSLK